MIKEYFATEKKSTCETSVESRIQTIRIERVPQVRCDLSQYIKILHNDYKV